MAIIPSAKLQVTNLKTASTGSGYCVQEVSYPAAVTSTVVLNTIVTSNSLFTITPRFPLNNATGSVFPLPYVDFTTGATSGSYTLTTNTTPGTILPVSVLIIN